MTARGRVTDRFRSGTWSFVSLDNRFLTCYVQRVKTATALPTAPVPKYEIGAKVRVNIQNPPSWAWGAAKAFQGQPGIIAEVQVAERMTGHPKKEPAYCVTFDTPIPSYWKWGSTITANWFDESELEKT